MGGVEQAQLHQLVGHDVLDHLHPDPLEGRAACGEVVLENPLGEGLAHHRPGVLDAQPGAEIGDVLRRGLRGDPVHHAVGEGDVLFDPDRQLRIAHSGLGDDGGARDLAVAGQVVAAHDREGAGTGLAASAQRLHDVAEGGGGRVRVGGVMDGARGLGAEGAGGVVDVVSALGHRQGDDPRGGCGHEAQDGLGVVGGEEEVVDRADDGGLVAAVGVFEGQGVGVVLGGECVAHAGVARQEPDPADAPVQAGLMRAAGCRAVPHEAVDVHGLVGAVESADADVDDSGRDRRAVVGGGEVAAVGGGGHGGSPASLGGYRGYRGYR